VDFAAVSSTSSEIKELWIFPSGSSLRFCIIQSFYFQVAALKGLSDYSICPFCRSFLLGIEGDGREPFCAREVEEVSFYMGQHLL
jgi:hypothetical protein